MVQRLTRSTLVILIAGLAALALSGTAEAQYKYFEPGAGTPATPGAFYGPGTGSNPVGGYYPPGYGYYPSPGGYWQGQAAMLDAYSNLGVSQEQARVIREQANQAKLDTKVKTIDVMGYERMNKYWYTDEQVDIQQKKIQFAMNNPPLPEITSGRALNTLMGYIDKLMAMGVRGATVPVDSAIVKLMVVSAGGDSGNVGLLKEMDGLDWPVALDGASQKTLDDLLKRATSDARTGGKVTNATISQINKATTAIEAELTQKFRKSEIDGGDFLDGKHFLERVRDATVALKQPTTAKILSGQMAPQGDTVDQVVYSMTSKGLTFNRCQPGNEYAYVAMHTAFVNFAMGTDRPDTGFRVRVPGNPTSITLQPK